MPAILVAILIAFLTPADASLAMLQPGMTAPSFSVVDLDGRTHSDAEYFADDAVTVIIFWSTWSKASSSCLSRMDAVYKANSWKKLRMIAVAVEEQESGAETVARIREKARAAGLKMPVLVDADLSMFQSFGVIAVPTTVIMDAKKTILYELSGFPLVGSEAMTDYLNGLLSGGRQREPLAAESGHRPDKKALRFMNMGLKALEKKTTAAMAETWFAKAVEADPAFSGAYVALARYYMRSEKAAEAGMLLEKALSLDAKDTAALTAIGELRIAEGRAKEASGFLQRAVETDGFYAPAHYLLGFALAKLGDRDGAMKHFGEAIGINANDADAYRYRGVAHEIFGDMKAANADYSKALELRKLRKD
ncbi:MAG: redoxin domain-containing protein [Nitrospirae bacterium]|nr:redoxin domain-containing protein [Nitrospirota bacterium]